MCFTFTILIYFLLSIFKPTEGEDEFEQTRSKCRLERVPKVPKGKSCSCQGSQYIEEEEEEKV
jgi:hypothetical protein